MEPFNVQRVYYLPGGLVLSHVLPARKVLVLVEPEALHAALPHSTFDAIKLEVGTVQLQHLKL